jgi:LmbE family N-acetylglucosaminyl deacetylase
MKKDLIQKIIQNKTPCVILSPHCDDAALSCGTLLTKLTGKTDIKIINVFTKANNKPHTLSAKQALKYANYTDAIKYYEARCEEDKKALMHLKISTVNLGFEDALFRIKKQHSFWGKFIPELNHIYPTYRWHIVGNIASDDYAVEELETKLKKMIKKGTIVFAPYGIGDNVDHKIVRKVSEKLYPACILYADFPYSYRLQTYGKPISGRQRYALRASLPLKKKMIQLYKSQFLGLFPNGIIPKHDEVFYYNE